MRTVRAATVAALTTLAVTAPAALPHSEVVSTNPKKGATLERLPTVISVTFGEPIARPGASTVVLGGRNYTSRVRLNPRNARVLQIITRGGTRAGRYTVRWQATSQDGHRQSGTFSFRVRVR